MAVLSVIAVYSFPTFNDEYMGAMAPLVLFAATVTLSIEAAVAQRVMRRYLPKPEGSPHAS